MDTKTYKFLADKLAKAFFFITNSSYIRVLMYLQNISFARLFFFLIEFYNLKITSQNTNNHDNRIMEPCFEEDETFAQCSRMDNSCSRQDADVDENMKLLRLPGIRVGGITFKLTNASQI